MKPIVRVRHIQRGDEPPDRVERGRIGIHRVNLKAAAQKVWKIASRAASGVKHSPAMIESAAKELIEEIDVDLTELPSQFRG